MKRIMLAGLVACCLALVAIVAWAESSGGSGPPAAARYSSAGKVIAALNHGGLRCTGTYNSSPPVVSGASSEASCSFPSSPYDTELVDVFPGTVTTRMVLRNSVSTGTTKIWSVVGPNWWFQTTKAHAKRVQKILGGRIVGGPWHPGASTSGPLPTLSAQDASRVCADLNALEFTGYSSADAQQTVAQADSSWLPGSNPAADVAAAIKQQCPGD
jgi:hypothetical protein